MQYATSPCILIADDERLIRELMVMELREAGFVVVSCSDATTALHYLSLGERADVLVTDVQMPGPINGLVLSAEAKAQRPKLPIVYATACDLTEDLMVPGSHYFRKPYYIGELVRLFNKIIY